MAHISVLNGPNLNLLGTREPEVYGHTTLADIEEQLRAQTDAGGHRLDFYQSNAEHEILSRVHAAGQAGVDIILINPAALTHTSIALRDALLGVGIPFIEVHLSNVFAREAFRHRSYLSDVAVGVISGFGAHSYAMALDAALKRVSAA